MGFSGGSIWQLLIILAIAAVIFGTKRLKNIGSDLGDALKGFKDAMKEKEEIEVKKPADTLSANPSQSIPTSTPIPSAENTQNTANNQNQNKV